jgi:hypothetical protein
LLAQFLRFAEKFLVFEEDPIQFERLIDRELVAQHHVAYVDGIGQSRVFSEFFQSGGGIVVVHEVILPLGASRWDDEVSGVQAFGPWQFGAQEIGKPLLLDGKPPQQPGFLTSLLVAARI